jgi:FkbM family methyltransferase
MLVRKFIASLFRLVFRIEALQSHFFGVHKYLIQPLRLFKGVKKEITFNGNLTLTLDVEDWLPQQLYFLGRYEEHEINFIKRTLMPGDVFVDVGANIGLYSLVASRLVGGSGQVYAFEPYSDSFLQLSHHITVNKIQNVIAEKQAVSSGISGIQLRGSVSNHNSGMVSQFHAHGDLVETVASISLDMYKSTHIPRTIRLIKMDIEGGEGEALKGMKNILTTDRPILLIELDDRLLEKAGTTSKSIVNWLEQLHYLRQYPDKDGRLHVKAPLNHDSFNSVFVPY